MHFLIASAMLDIYLCNPNLACPAIGVFDMSSYILSQLVYCIWLPLVVLLHGRIQPCPLVWTSQQRASLYRLLRMILYILQGIVGETYNRMLAGDAVNDPKNALYLPDDYQFHGKVSTHKVWPGHVVLALIFCQLSHAQDGSNSTPVLLPSLCCSTSTPSVPWTGRTAKTYAVG